MAWHYGDDQIALTCDDQFMFGQDIMVAPILAANQRSRYVYFPKGNWYALDSEPVGDKIEEGVGDGPGQGHASSNGPIAGGQTHRIECRLGRVPAFVREGAIIALADVMQSTQDYNASAIIFHAFGSKAEGKYFEDDGHSLDYQNDKFNEWQINVTGGRFETRSLHKAFDCTGQRYFYRSSGASKRHPLSLEN
jgi:alpha-glucosidase (family GH31 glycosyl hydrolase)